MKLTIFFSLVLCLIVVGVDPGPARGQVAAQQTAVPTRVMVRAVSQDAKIIQDPVGGARIVIRDVETGQILAEGLQKGRSGSTEKIMLEPRRRGVSIYDTEGAAGFLATLLLNRPTRVEFVAEGPLAYPQAMQRASTTMVLVPGRHVLGDGVVLTLHGFIVEILEPGDVAAIEPGERVPVRAKVTMLCGCPTEPGGLWDADGYDIVAQWVNEGVVVDEVPLRFSGTKSIYEGEPVVPEGEQVELRVLAMDPESVNFGMATRVMTTAVAE